jgi:hypothetical protein
MLRIKRSPFPLESIFQFVSQPASQFIGTWVPPLQHTVADSSEVQFLRVKLKMCLLPDREGALSKCLTFSFRADVLQRGDRGLDPP